MKTFSNNIDDLLKIETIILTCYGENGKSALIQPDRDANSSFILTNDGITILNSVQIKNNHLYFLINRLLKDHDQDGAKNFFIYMVTASKIVLKPENFFFSLDDLRSAFKQLSLANILQKLSNEWNKIMDKNENFIRLTDPSDVLAHFSKMCVYHNLDSFNPNLSKISKKLLGDFVNFKLKNEKKNFIKCENSIRQSMDDFSFIAEYCDSLDLEQSKILENQFLIDRKFTFCSKHLASGVINSIFVLKEKNLNADIEITEDLNSVITKLKQANGQIKFTQEFLSKISENYINLIFFEGFLSETKKTQLKSIECSFIDHVTRERIDFLTNRLGIDPIESQNNKLDTRNV
ncbi:hypothetical protein BpHYR1_045156 [Brachionus plicatilis]|uniref:Uncharacterized protein n=1 Tax=Brachionus plicatilis TaxID=10195 RepID=A0A3M7SJL3_BRAPC|nr:hypothetical protein BpHYR1_045156 [Brachionus plicatilis]